MSSFLSKFKGGASNAATANGSLSIKKDPNAPQPTALEKLLADAGPIKEDGSDKFFGMENFGSTCYYNSIIQCLYHSPPFREHVLNFPTRTTPKPLPSTIPESLSDESHISEPPPTPGMNGFMSGLSPLKTKGAPSSPTMKKSPMSPIVPNAQQPGKEENKDSPEYRKKMALMTGPIIQLNHASGTQYGMAESMFTSLKDMFEAISHHGSRTGVISPQRATDLVRSLNSVFSAPMHQDAHECLNFVLNEIVEDLERYAKLLSKESSDAGSAISSVGESLSYSPPNTKWVHELFEGTMTSETKCLTCQNTSAREEAYLDLSVDLGLFSSVTSCLWKFSEEEMLNERNKFHCDRCYGLQEAEKRMKIKRLPKILALHLKRFTYTEDLQRLQKLHHRVAYPYYLRLFNLTDDADDQDKIYELYGVVVHIGTSPYQGHYVSIIKTQDRGWLLFDDENVEPVEKSFVRNFFGNEQGLACAYVLFYKETCWEDAEKDMDDEDRAALAQGTPFGFKDQMMNGKANGFHTNGLHNAPIPPSPLVDDGEFNGLDRSVTAPQTPPLPNGNIPFSNPLEHVASSPVLPFLSKKKSSAMLKKSAEKDQKTKEANEKERAKESQKAIKEKKKDGKILQRWQSKKDTPIPVPVENPYVPRTSTSAGSRSSQLQDEAPPTSAPRTSLGDAPKDAPATSFVNRFRQSSKSIKGKPRLWGTKKTDASQSQSLLNNATPTPTAFPPPSPSHPSPPPPHLSLSHYQTAELPPDPSPAPLYHALTTPNYPSPTLEEPPQLTHASLTPQMRSSETRTPTPTALPVMDEGRKKERRGFFGLGRKKSVAGL